MTTQQTTLVLLIAMAVYVAVQRLQLEHLNRRVKSMTEGNLDADLQVFGFGCVKSLALNLSELFLRLNQNMKAISAHAVEVGKAANQFKHVSEEMGRSATVTSEQANTVSSASSEVSENIQTVAASADEMDVGMREIARSAAEAATVAAKGVQVAETTNETVSRLGRSSAEIGNVIKVISSVTEQTNLLALNAAIEAARAGEAGRGFAVVAREVKELAFETARATEDVGGKVKAIQDSSREAVTAIEEIGGIIQKISDIQGTIASSVEQQTCASREIGRSVTQAALGGADIATNITGVAEKAASTMTHAQDLLNVADDLGRMAKLIEDLLDPMNTLEEPVAG